MPTLVAEKVDMTKIGEIHGAFDKNIEKIREISFDILLNTGSSYKVLITFIKDKVRYKFADGSSATVEKEKFCDRLRDINIPERAWFSHFKKTGRMMRGVNLWKISFEYEDGIKPVDIYGDCDYPDNFGDFLDLAGFDQPDSTDAAKLRQEMLKFFAGLSKWKI